MPTVTLNKKRVLELLGKKYDDKFLADRIAMLGTDLEAITDTEITVEVFPNRPDMLSEEGLARGLRSFLEIEAGFKKYRVEKSGFSVSNTSTLAQWPYVVAAIVKGLKFDDNKIKQVIQLQEKLGVTLLRRRKKGAIGIYPLDKIKMPVKFSAADPEKIRFRPLEYPEIISGSEILEKHPTGREYAPICKEWSRLPYFADADGKIMSMPPIINSHDVGKISGSTKDVFVEATGTDINTINIALNILVAALADMGGKIYSLKIISGKEKVDTPNLEPSKMKLDTLYVNKLLGLNLSDHEVKSNLAKMGIGFEAGRALIPAYRADILHPMDLVEDIAIAYGYENFAPEIPKVATIGEESHEAILKRKLAEVLIGQGFLECNTYHLSSKGTLWEKMNLKKSDMINLSNSVNADYDTMRNSILPILMKVLSENKHNEYPQRLFEAGIVFEESTKQETGVLEKPTLAAVMAHPDADFTEIKGILSALFEAFDIKYEIREKENPVFIPGRCVEIFVAGKPAGVMGEIHPQVLNNWEIEMPTAAFEVDVEKVFG